MAPYPVQTPFGIQYQDMPVEIDEAILQEDCTNNRGEIFQGN